MSDEVSGICLTSVLFLSTAHMQSIRSLLGQSGTQPWPAIAVHLSQTGRKPSTSFDARISHFSLTLLIPSSFTVSLPLSIFLFASFPRFFFNSLTSFPHILLTILIWNDSKTNGVNAFENQCRVTDSICYCVCFSSGISHVMGKCFKTIWKYVPEARLMSLLTAAAGTLGIWHR